MSFWRKNRTMFLLSVCVGVVSGCGGGGDGGGSDGVQGGAGPSVVASPASATLTWNPVPPPSTVNGYKVYFGTSTGNYVPPDGGNVDVGNATQVALNLQSGETYFFSVTAYNSAGESGFSNEVSKAIP